MKGTAFPSPFAALSFPDSEKVLIYCWVNRESFQVATGPTWVQMHDLLNHNCASLSTQPQCLSYTNIILPYFFGYKMEFFFLPKQSQRSRSVLQEGSRSLRLFRKGKISIIAKFHRTDLFILSHSRGTKPPSYSRINTVILLHVSGALNFAKGGGGGL